MRLFHRLYSSCASTLTLPLNTHPIGYLTLPGLVNYESALQIQKQLVARRHQITQKTLHTDLPADIILFLQHTPTYTAGRRIRGKSNVEEEARLKVLGADYYETMRGGQVTFHGPGQLIAYPILDIRDYQLNVRCYVSRLEKTIIDCCEKFDIKAGTTEDTGVWVNKQDKIAALGVHLQRYVTSHGLALNCNTDLNWYKHIVPCGLEDKGITSISKELDKDVTVDEVVPKLVDSFSKLFQKEMVQVDNLEQLLVKR